MLDKRRQKKTLKRLKDRGLLRYARNFATLAISLRSQFRSARNFATCTLCTLCSLWLKNRFQSLIGIINKNLH
jgi:hypothetical protein